jgi:hypothetical protein
MRLNGRKPVPAEMPVGASSPGQRVPARLHRPRTGRPRSSRRPKRWRRAHSGPLTGDWLGEPGSPAGPPIGRHGRRRIAAIPDSDVPELNPPGFIQFRALRRERLAAGDPGWKRCGGRSFREGPRDVRRREQGTAAAPHFTPQHAECGYSGQSPGSGPRAPEPPSPARGATGPRPGPDIGGRGDHVGPGPPQRDAPTDRRRGAPGPRRRQRDAAPGVVEVAR